MPFTSRSRGVYRRRNRRRILVASATAPQAIGAWGGIFWENLCTEFDHSRTAQEILDGKVWAVQWKTSVAGVFQTQALDVAYSAAEAATREALWDDHHAFQVEVEAENWGAADTLRLAILAF